MRALVTGGAGFVGSHLVDRLLFKGDEVLVLDDLSTGRFDNVRPHLGRAGFRFVEGTILERALVQELVSSCDAVFHLAAAVGVRRIIEQPRSSIEINLRGTEHVLAAARPGQHRVLITSTSEVYGKNDSGPLSESADSIVGPTTITRWLYAITKAADECLTLAYARETGLDAVVVRLFNTIGPRQSGQYGMVVPRFLRQALRGEPITVYGDGRQTRCFTYVEDVVTAMLALIDNPRAVGEVFNIGHEREVSIERLAHLVRERAGSASEIVHVPYNEAYGTGFEDMQRRVPDVAKLRCVTQFAPSIELEEALNRIIAAMRTESSGQAADR